jgi:receptor expression-enhancing protein 5/6
MINKLDNALNNVPALIKLENKTKVPKVYVVVGAGSILTLMIFLNLWGDLLSNLVGFVYPAYASFKAIESPSKEDDVQWLTYWVVFGFMNVIEFYSDILLFWLPFYYFFKAAIILWLVLPQTMVILIYSGSSVGLLKGAKTISRSRTRFN